MKMFKNKLMSKRGLFVLSILLVVCFVIFSGKETIFSDDLTSGEAVSCENVVVFGIRVKSNIKRVDGALSSIVNEYQITKTNKPSYVFVGETWENMLGMKVYSSGSMSFITSQILKRLMDINEHTENMKSSENTKVFYETLINNSHKLPIGDRPFGTGWPFRTRQPGSDKTIWIEIEKNLMHGLDHNCGGLETL